MSADTFFWHDYETFGTDPRKDRPAQFAGIRTDQNFNIVDDPLVLYCKPHFDYLPDPESCLLTGITPNLAESKGIIEAEFIAKIHQQMSQPGTCSLGYNTLRFDDEFTRYCLYRNFYDPYAREWQNGNSRWDLIDVVRAAAALRPEGVVWPRDEQNKPCFRLTALTNANHLTHKSAHDALSDVYATIELAKMISSAQTKLFEFLLANRFKQKILKLLKLGTMTPVIHVSGRYPSHMNCLAIVLPLCQHPGNANGIIVYDLSVDPEPLLSLPADEIQQRIFTATDQLPEGVVRIPLKTVHINKCPVIAPISVLRPTDKERLQLDVNYCYVQLEKLKNNYLSVVNKIESVFAANPVTSEPDPEWALYSGGFLADSDKLKVAKIRTATSCELKHIKTDFADPRFDTLLYRYKARNYPDSLSKSESENWLEFCAQRLVGNSTSSVRTFTEFFDRLNVLKKQPEADQLIISELENFAKNKLETLGKATGSSL